MCDTIDLRMQDTQENWTDIKLSRGHYTRKKPDRYPWLNDMVETFARSRDIPVDNKSTLCW